MQGMFSDHNIIKLEINKRRYLENSPNILKLNSISMCQKRKSQGKLEDILNQMKIKTKHIKTCRVQLKQCLERTL